MNKQQAIEKACQVLRLRVRYDGASLPLPGTPFPGDDTHAIQEATRIYVETWIIPLLDAIESGDMTLIKRYYEHDRGHTMSQPWPVETTT